MTVTQALADLLPPESLEGDGWSGTSAANSSPEAIVRPSNADEVATVMAWASREGIGVLPAGFEVSGGPRGEQVPGGRWLLLSSERLEGIDQYEAADLTVTAGAGTSLKTVAAALAGNDQWAPFDPPYFPERSLGGLVSTGDSGPLSMGYGELRNHVLGLTVVTGDGRLLDLGGRVVKNVAGFDVVKAVVGSRGTLAVITSVCLRAFPRPPVDRVLVVRGESVEGLVDVALSVGTAPVLPASCVLTDDFDGGGPAVVVRLHGALDTVDADQRTLEAHLSASFSMLDDSRFGPALASLRDRATGQTLRARVSVLPSRLGAALGTLATIGYEAVVVDAYHGSIRVGLREGPIEALAEAQTAIEALGGAVRVSAAAGAPLPAGLGSEPTDGERRLTGRLREAFDPKGVLWPARR